uniref:Uncharacterized protein n=1 Tax=Lactuca sativa TaxID=4236 RepID=A0A9R1XJB5_LACSA|nr:hypothetical protein LSAT_V11C300126220 [Lactuca sativa]
MLLTFCLLFLIHKVIASTSFTPKSTVCNKIPSFDKHNFSAWKSKDMEALYFMDIVMLDIINKGHITVMHQSSSDGVSGSKIKGKPVPGFKKEEKRILNLDVKARTTI